MKIYKKMLHSYNQAFGRLGTLHNSVHTHTHKQPNLLTRTTDEISVRR